MSDDAHGPEATGEAPAGEPATSLDKGPTTSLDKGGRRDSVAPGGSDLRPEPDPWAPPVAGARGAGGPGHTLASDVPPSWPAPSVHDQQTVTSVPSPGLTANPFAPPGSMASMPYAAHGEPVPPPPIAPDGPGQVPYGYPGPVGYGYPPGPGAAGYYGWPGMQAMPSNGMGTAGLVLGIISAVVFCLWPVAIVVGVLAVIFGAIGRGKARRGEATNPGQALAGIICGVAGVVLGLGMVALLIVAP